MLKWICFFSLASLGTAFGDSPHVGVVTRSFTPHSASYDWRGAHTHALITTIWYPADASSTSRPQWIGAPGAPFASAGEAAPNAPLAASSKPYPLVLLSHGSGGSALMLAWLGIELAAHGYVAAAVNHPGNNALEDYTVPGFTLWWERAADITEVLNAMLADPMFGQRIDRKRIGAAGFSIGGFTMIELAGGIGDLETYNRFCKSPEADAICKDQQEFPGLLAKGAAMERSDADFRKAIAMGRKAHGDRRIHAVFAIAPGVGQAFHADSLASIAIPVEIVAGANDRVVPVGTNAQYLADHIPHAHVTVYPGGAGHYTFLAACTDLGKKQQPIFCVDAPDVDRAAVHAETARRALAFFDEKLR